MLDHPLTVADLGEGASAAGGEEQLAGATLLRHPSAGSLYLNFYYDLGSLTPEECSIWTCSPMCWTSWTPRATRPSS